MSSGFKSNYNDSGYTVTTYDQNNNIITTIPSRDIYLTTQQVGIYMLDGTRQISAVNYQIFCSLSSLRNCGVPIDSDDAWIVYPGFGFQLFNKVSYSEPISRLYTNTANIPLLFTFTTGGFSNTGFIIKDDIGNNTVSNQTASIKIYFRGIEITINGLS